MVKLSSERVVGPNLFLVGAAKSGTTALARYLDQHPSIFVCRPKEPNFFALPVGESPRCVGPMDSDSLTQLLLGHAVTDVEEYSGLFARAESATTRVDASVRYLYYPESAERIHHAVPFDRGTGSAAKKPVGKPGPIRLQDHGSPVRFRNLWIKRDF